MINAIEEYNKHIASVHAFVSAGNKDMALKMLEILNTAYPDKAEELLWERLNIQYDLEQAKKKSDEIYRSNYEVVKDYPLLYGECSENPDWFVVRKESDCIICANIAEKKAREIWHYNSVIDHESILRHVVMVESALFTDQIEEIEKATELENGANGIKNPLFLAYSSWEWEIFLQVIDIGELIDRNRYLFAVDEAGVRKCFSDSTVVIPENLMTLSARGLKFENALLETIQSREIKLEQTLVKIRQYYKDHVEEIDNRIRQRKPRILFWTCRFTTVIQYHTGNMMDVMARLGCECFFLIEPDDLRRITPSREAEVFEEFRPDVILCIDHFRFENSICDQPGLMYVTWIQDPSDHIMDPMVKDRLGKRDVLLNHIIGSRELQELYPNMLVDAPVPGNQYVYKPYELTDEEKRKYEADICFVCHASDVDDWISGRVKHYKELGISDGLISAIENIYQDYCKDAKDGYFLYDRSDFSKYLIKDLESHGFAFDAPQVSYWADEMYTWLNQRVFRQVLVDWIIEAGFTNIKLWGNGWSTSPKYSGYAMGVAKNGDVLSKILQASKIVIGNNIMTTGAARAWESMLSGAFYLSNYIPPENDWVDIRKLVPHDAIVMFTDRTDLIEKIRYYLEHEEERRAMALKGRKAALEYMTFDALAQKILNMLPEYI